MTFGDAKSTGAREALTQGEEAGREGGRPRRPARPRAGGLGAGPGQTRPGAPTGSPQPAAAGGTGVPRTAKLRWPQPHGISADSTPGCRSPSPGERWGRRQRTQEPAAAQRKAPEVKGRDRNRLTNRKFDSNRKRAGGGTAVSLVFLRVVMLGGSCQHFLLATAEPGLSETDRCADARTSGWLTAFACAVHAPVSRVRALFLLF